MSIITDEQFAELASQLGNGFQEELPETYMFNERVLLYLRYCSLEELLTNSDSSVRELVSIILEKAKE